MTALTAVILSAVLMNTDKGELHLLLCQPHCTAADIFFRYYTKIGEWVPYAVAAGLLFYRVGWSAFVTAGIVLSGLSTQILKHIVDAPRPLSWFANNMPDITLPLVEGVKMSQYFSFPSGHTTSFFALFLALSIIVSDATPRVATRSIMQIIFFALALLGGYSRIYLSQHFLADVLGGMVVGTLITLLLSLTLSYFTPQKWWKMHFFAKKMQKNLHS